jgi:C_GCAxxG_C_C family probable redox protein
MFLAGHHCAQSVLAAFSVGEGGLPPRLAVRLATALGAGCGRQSLMCGAVTGALLAIGLRFGEDGTVDPAAREAVYEKTNAFCRRFAERNGTLMCGELLGLDLATEAGRAEMSEKDWRNLKCARYVRDAGEILEELGL